MNEPAMDNLVVLNAVSREYPSHAGAPPVQALKKLSLRVARGSRVAIRGESGSGKSTLLNLLGGLDAPDSGEVTIDGRNLTALSERQLADYRARTVGFVFQTFQLLPTLSARENVELPMEALYAGPTERRDRAEELLQAVGMADRADHRPGRLSGGEQQRVAIARALANRPPLILADEPTGNLDKKNRRVVVSLLNQINRDFGITLIIVTHDPNVADQCNVVHLIRRGQIKREYRPTEMPARPPPDDEDDDEEDEEGN
ncbi:MAG: ABC transporter ATP-binding protein [Thermoplasmata archaeon]|nr:ABC transporter ATP-binding protein [Thermoplasmata archaeon]